MKVLKIGLIVVVLALVAVFGMQMVASESAEVVVLHSQGGEGVEETRLWVVDLDGAQFLRASGDSGWYQRLVAQPSVRLERDGVTRAYRAEADLNLEGEINSLMAAKYGWRDSYIDMVIGGRDDAIAVRLSPAT
jgi:hypothetical protein